MQINIIVITLGAYSSLKHGLFQDLCFQPKILILDIIHIHRLRQRISQLTNQY